MALSAREADVAPFSDEFSDQHRTRENGLEATLTICEGVSRKHGPGRPFNCVLHARFDLYARSIAKGGKQIRIDIVDSRSAS